MDSRARGFFLSPLMTLFERSSFISRGLGRFHLCPSVMALIPQFSILSQLSTCRQLEVLRDNNANTYCLRLGNLYPSNQRCINTAYFLLPSSQLLIQDSQSLKDPSTFYSPSTKKVFTTKGPDEWVPRRTTDLIKRCGNEPWFFCAR